MKESFLEANPDQQNCNKLGNYAYTEGGQNTVVSDITFVGLCLQRSYTQLADSDEELISILDLLNTRNK